MACCPKPLIALSPLPPSYLHHPLPPSFLPSAAKGRLLSLFFLLVSFFSFLSIYFMLTFSFDPFMFYRPFLSVLILSFSLRFVLQFQIIRNITCISLFPSLSHKSKQIKSRKLSFCLSEALFMQLVSGSVAQHQLEQMLDMSILMRELLMQMKSICL